MQNLGKTKNIIEIHCKTLGENKIFNEKHCNTLGKQIFVWKAIAIAFVIDPIASGAMVLEH